MYKNNNLLYRLIDDIIVKEQMIISFQNKCVKTKTNPPITHNILPTIKVHVGQ